MWPSFLAYTKESPKKYKGKLAVGPNLLSFLAERSNQHDSFTRLLHFYSCFQRNPYWGHLRPYVHMAKWPYRPKMAIWPFGHMTILHQNRSKWASTETAIKMQQPGEGIKLIRPFCKKWEQIWSDGKFSYVFFQTFLCICRKWWPHLINALKLTKFFLVHPEV